VDTDTELKRDDILLSANHEMRIEIGDVCCSLNCHDGDVLGNLKQLYRNFLSDKPADVIITLDVVDRLNADELEEALSQTSLTLEGNHFVAAGLTLEGEFDIANRTLSMAVEKLLFNPCLEFKLMNRLFPMVYHTIYRAKYGGRPSAMLVHSCGILRRGQVLLFIGPCNAGKTTIAQLCGDQHGQVVNDEMLLVSWLHRGTGSLLARGVPIIGGISQRLNTEGLLRCILALKQSNRTTVRRLDRLEAYLRLIHQVLLPEQFGANNSHSSLSMTTEFSDYVTRMVPFYELEFTMDRTALWQVIEELEESLEREGKGDRRPDNQG
jgi:hypothetical protein